MKITKITVTYKETHSFGRYQNVSPSVTIEADFDHKQDPAVGCIRDIMALAKSRIRAEIDEVLEKNRRSPN